MYSFSRLYSSFAALNLVVSYSRCFFVSFLLFFSPHSLLSFAKGKERPRTCLANIWTTFKRTFQPEAAKTKTTKYYTERKDSLIIPATKQQKKKSSNKECEADVTDMQERKASDKLFRRARAMNGPTRRERSYRY